MGGVELLFNRGEEGAGNAEIELRIGLVGLQPAVAGVQHGARGASAVVANTIKMHQLRGSGIVLARMGKGGCHVDGVDVVDIIVREIGEHAAAIRRLPPEELEGKLVGLVPRHLLGNEVVDPGTFVDLRQLPVVSKGIGVPADAHIDAEARLEVALADQQLPYLRFAIGHIKVRLYPHAAHHLPTAFLHPLLDPLELRRVFLLQPLVVGRGRLAVGIFRILIHQLQGGAEGLAHHLDGLGPRPQPGSVDVGVSGEVDIRLLQQGTQGHHALVSLAQGIVKSSLVAVT